MLAFCIFGVFTPLVAEGNMVTPVTCDRFGAERTHVEIEFLNDVDHILGEMIEIAAEVVGNVLGIGQQTLKGEGRYVVEVIS